MGGGFKKGKVFLLCMDVEERRDFLKRSVFGGLSFVLGCSKEESLDEVVDTRDWSFLNEPIYYPGITDMSAQQVKESCVPVTEDYDLIGPDRNPNINTIVGQNQHELNRRRINYGTHKINVTRQMYAAPTEAFKAEAVVEYLRESLAHLESRLDLTHGELKFRIINPGEIPENRDKTIFVGSHLYEVKTGHFINRKTGDTEYTPPPMAVRNQGCFSSSDDKEQYIFIGTSPYALVGIYSEVIPMTTDRAFREHIKKVGLEEALKVTEALSEGISYILSTEFVRMKKVPNGERLVREIFSRQQDESGRYEYQNKAIKWLQTHGIQAGLDLYLKDPSEFGKAILGK